MIVMQVNTEPQLKLKLLIKAEFKGFRTSV